jgi:hypothetical protein
VKGIYKARKKRMSGPRGENRCEIGEGVRDIYRARKQLTSGPKGVCSVLLHSGLKV